MSQKPSRNFTAEQKAEAVRIVHQSRKSVNQVAKEMGLTPSALRNWVKQDTIDHHSNPQGQLTTAERKELSELRRELKRVQLRPYELIHAEKVNFPIALMCQVLQVSKSGYYAWRQRKPCTTT